MRTSMSESLLDRQRIKREGPHGARVIILLDTYNVLVIDRQQSSEVVQLSIWTDFLTTWHRGRVFVGADNECSD